MITNFIKDVKKIFTEVYESDLTKLSLTELQYLNEKVMDLYKNPILGKKNSDTERLNSFYAYTVLSYYTAVVRKGKNAADFMHFLDNLEESLLVKPDTTKDVVLSYLKDISRIIPRYVERRHKVDNFERKIVMESDLNSYNYLYYYGEKITQNHIQIVDFFNSKVDDNKLTDMAKCTIEAFLRGLKNSNIDDSKKSFVTLVYPIGFEKLAKRIVELFEGKFQVVLLNGSSPFDKQINYNFRYDYNFHLTEEFVKEYLTLFESEVKRKKNIFEKYAGIICVEMFGEDRFIPKNGDEIFDKSKELAALSQDFDTKFTNLYMKNIRKNTSFCIISYPCPEIGECFEDVFDETIKINTLSNSKYSQIHQKIIDVLDKSTHLHITGKNGNKTDLTVAFQKLENPAKETLFENCCADVNVPVGEVFTSPKLKGTNGILHVSKIYLNGWKFENLILKIKDGFIEEYSCTNFLTEEENKEYINEHLLFDNKTLPMGECAIGTNTYAYVMGNKYNINDKLDILIAEKTGPHFAFGDTCYSVDEDTITFNPDGKKIVAKDNEVSIKRLSSNEEEASQAYYGCHTDVTIPYYELNDIIAVNGDIEIPIIHDGKFVLKGTEELNIEGM